MRLNSLILGFNIVLSVPKFTANLYWMCLSVDLRCTKADIVQHSGKFWDTQYVYQVQRLESGGYGCSRDQLRANIPPANERELRLM